MSKPTAPWSLDYWEKLNEETSVQALKCGTEVQAWAAINKQARLVLRSYSTSFFVVTRFLPPFKRQQVEAIYAAVRYPDEIVDTFNLSNLKRYELLDEWARSYDLALQAKSIQECLRMGIPTFIASFAEVVKTAKIPPEHYHSFLEAMRLDINPRQFETLDELIDTYIYGSAIVVGYFLAYVYGTANEGIEGEEFERVLKSSRDLGIALQLTNFLRDVAEDQRRGRLYLPLEMLRAQGIQKPDAMNPTQHQGFNHVLNSLTEISENYYAIAAENLNAFDPNCRTAIRACINVYRELNQQIKNSPRGILHRESVPLRRKFQVLPPSKYWRLPVAYLSN
jgi:15-cis-phytoene synthase